MQLLCVYVWVRECNSERGQIRSYVSSHLSVAKFDSVLGVCVCVKPAMHAKMAHHKGAHQKVAGGKLVKQRSDASMRDEFAKAQQQLHSEQTKMRHIEEHDHVKAAEQKINLERLKAHQQANAYEDHLSKINDAVFPRSMDSGMGQSSSHAVSHALTDDMHVPMITKADYERHPMLKRKALHGSNKLYRRVKNSGRDFARQVALVLKHTRIGRAASRGASAPELPRAACNQPEFRTRDFVKVT